MSTTPWVKKREGQEPSLRALELAWHYATGLRIERPSEDETVLVLPYVRNFEEGRTNHGFRDTRGRPELIDEIAEAGTSPALKELLRHARPAYFQVFLHRLRPAHLAAFGAERSLSGRRLCPAAVLDLAREAIHRRRQMLLGRALEAHLDSRVGDDDWVVRFAVAMVGAAELGGPEQVWSPVIEFSALGETAAEATASAERLMLALRDLVAPVRLAIGAGRGILTRMGSARDSGRCL